MASEYLTTADIIKFNDVDMDVIPSDVLNKAVLLGPGGLKAQQATSVQFSYTLETGAPASSFRLPNSGIENTVGAEEKVNVDLMFLDSTSYIDVAVAKAHDKGEQFAVAQHAASRIRNAMFDVEKQILLGQTGGSAGGFLGLADNSDLNSASSDQVVTAVASGSVSNDATSVYMVHSSDEGVEVIWGQGGIISVSDTEVVSHNDALGRPYNAYKTRIDGYCGLKYGTKYASARLANIIAANPLTDDLLADLFAKFPMYLKPTHVVMNRAALAMLQKSRSSYHPLGAPSVRPIDWEGIPIVVSDAITSTEAGI